jgi:hypothetical protein
MELIITVYNLINLIKISINRYNCQFWAEMTFPPIPKLAPRCLQYASSAYAYPFSDLKTTIFSPAISTD